MPALTALPVIDLDVSSGKSRVPLLFCDKVESVDGYVQHEGRPTLFALIRFGQFTSVSKLMGFDAGDDFNDHRFECKLLCLA